MVTKKIRPTVWIHELELHFKMKQMQTSTRFSMPLLLEDEAYEWWHQLDLDVQEHRRYEILTWEEFTNVFLKCLILKQQMIIA